MYAVVKYSTNHVIGWTKKITQARNMALNESNKSNRTVCVLKEIETYRGNKKV